MSRIYGGVVGLVVPAVVRKHICDARLDEYLYSVFSDPGEVIAAASGADTV